MAKKGNTTKQDFNTLAKQDKQYEDKKGRGKPSSKPKAIGHGMVALKEVVDVKPIIIELPDDIMDEIELALDPVFVAKMRAAELREQAFAALKERNEYRNALDAAKQKVKDLGPKVDRLMRAYWEAWEAKYPGTSKWIHMREASCVAHKKRIEEILLKAAKSKEPEMQELMDAEADLVMIEDWLEQNGGNYIALFAEAEKVCADAGLDYYAIWPMKENGNGNGKKSNKKEVVE